MWRIILKAPSDRLAADATTYLVNLYLDVCSSLLSIGEYLLTLAQSRIICQRSVKVAEVTHFKIVERCINQLTSAASGSGGTDKSPKQTEDIMSIDFPGESCSSQEFFRSLDLLDHFVKGYKTRSRYNQGLQESNQASTVDMITGVVLTLRLRWHGLNYQSPVGKFFLVNINLAYCYRYIRSKLETWILAKTYTIASPNLWGGKGIA